MADAELVRPDYWDGALLASASDQGSLIETGIPEPTPLRRLTVAGAPRLYFKMMKPKPIVFPSITSVIHATTPTPDFLQRWISEHGERRAMYLRDERGAYGTLMHAMFAELLIKREFDLGTVGQRVKDYIAKDSLPYPADYWEHDLKMDLIGWADFVHDWNVRPTGIEVPMCSETRGSAGTGDLFAIIDPPEKKRGQKAHDVFAYIDWKGGRKYFADTYPIQCGEYVELHGENFGVKPDMIMLYGPKDWNAKTRIRYRYENITDHEYRHMFPTLLEQYRMRNQHQSPIVRLAGGLLELGKNNDHLVSVQYVDEIIAKMEEE